MGCYPAARSAPPGARKTGTGIVMGRVPATSTQDNIAGTAGIISGAIKKETCGILGRPRLGAHGDAERAEGRVRMKAGEIEKVLDLQAGSLPRAIGGAPP